jgi:lauroyl/myristoyl acyltransferase
VHGPLGIDGVEEIALHYALNIMSHSGALFDLEMKIEGAEIVRAALRKSHGTLIVAPHALLVLSLFRYLRDLGYPATIVSAAPFVHVYGTRLVACTLQPSSSLLIRVRSALRRGDVVCAMIDEGPRNSARTVQFETCAGPVYISDALIKLAKRCDADVIFTSARLDERQNIVLTFDAPLALTDTSELAIAKSFVNFLETHVERRCRRVST